MLLSSLFAADLKGETVYVNNDTGDDAFDGLSEKPVAGTKQGPFKTIKKAFISVKTSGKIEVANTGKPYKEQCSLSRGGGTPECPTIIEGNGAVISGLDVVPAEKWKAVKDDIYETEFYPMSNMLKGYKEHNYWIGSPQIWWLDGNPGINCKSFEELENTEKGFFWDKRKKKAFVHLPQGKKVSDVSIEMPVHGTSVCVNTDYVVVKNLKSMFSWNDGFDTHASSKNVIYKNCTATGNCGQAFSNHDLCTSTYENCAGQGCASSGACDVNSCMVLYRNCVFINNTFEAGVYATENAKITLENCIIAGNEPFEQIWQKGSSSLSLFNCLIIGKKGNPNPALKMENGVVYMNQCTIIDVPYLAEINEQNSGSLKIINCIIGRMEKPFLKTADKKRIISANNVYFDVPGIEYGGKVFTKEDWSEYQKASGLDVNSEWIDPLLAGNLNSALPAESPLRKKGKFYSAAVRIGAELTESVWKLYQETAESYSLPSGIFRKK